MGMKELIKKSFELHCKMRWLKSIDKEIAKYHKLRSNAQRQHYVVNAMIKKYEEIYGEHLRAGD